jgi:hypothetical protein
MERRETSTRAAFTEEERRQIALRITRDIRVASFLGKRSLSARGRATAYRTKARKISVALLHFGEFFSVEQVERNVRFGALALVRLADGTGAHVPLSFLSGEARLRLRQMFLALLDASLGLAEEQLELTARRKDAA